jgi:putative ABC transport system permease protein
MSWTTRVARRLTAKRTLWREMDEEMRQHLELETADLVRQGVPPAEARRQALVAFGALDAQREAGWDARGTRWLEDLARDLRYALRTLRRSPGFTTMAVLCVALGIGVTTTIFGVVNAFLIRPLPFPAADRLVAVYAANPPRDLHGINISRPEYLAWRERNRSFARIGMWTWSSLTFTGGGEAERVEAADVSPELFPLLGVTPLLGRGFLPGEEVPGRERVLLLSHALWQRRFAGDRQIVGRAVTVDSVPYTVVGVMPPWFTFPEQGLAWRPLAGDAQLDAPGNRFYAGAIGRLRPGTSLATARADFDRLSRELQREHPDANEGWEAELVPLRQDLVGDLRRPLLVMLAAVACVLLVACANVAGLLLARGNARRRELAIRTAIGAGRARVVRQLLTESLVIAALGGLAGAGLAVLGMRFAGTLFPDQVPFYLRLAVDGNVLACIGLLTAASAALCGALPALRANLDPGGTLKESAATSGETAARQRARRVLVIGEIALSMVLLTVAGLLLRSYRALEGTDLGFEQRGILAARVSLPATEYAEPARRIAFYQQLGDRLRALPGVVAVGSAQGIPFSGWDVQAEVSLDGVPAATGNGVREAHYQTVSPSFFAAIGVPVLRGRAPSERDRDPEAPVVVVNETFVRRYLAGRDPLDARVRIGGPDSRDPWATVVGVVGDYRHYRLPQPMGPAMYFSYPQGPTRTQTLVVRTTLDDPLALTPALREVLRELDPDVPAYQVTTFAREAERVLWRQRLQGQTLGAFALLGLLLAGVGLYSVVAYAVTQRSREISLRVALGATRRQVVASVVGQGARLTLWGIGCGLAGALAAGKLVAGLLHGVHPLDPLTLLGVPAVLAAASLLASLLPALAAARLQPQAALRS